MANTGNKKVRKVKNIGTLYYDNTKNKWVGQVENGKYDNGRVKYKKIYGDSQNSVIERMKEFQSSQGKYISTNENEASDILVKDFLKSFLQTVKKTKLKPASYTRENGTLKNHIIPYIGNYTITELTTLIIQAELINTLIAKGYSHSTIHKAYIFLNEGMRYAYKQSLIPNNPCEFVEEPSKKIFTRNKTIRFFNDSEIERFINSATSRNKHDNLSYENGYLIVALLYTGLRGGELMALKWSDINFDSHFVRVCRNIATIYDDNDKRTVIIQESTKTRDQRTVHLTKSAEKYFKLAKNFHKGDDNDFVFSTSGQRDLSSLEGTYASICKKANINNPQGTHTLRHTCASLLIRKGVDIKIVSEMLGHASVSFTYNTYVHLIEEEKAKVIGQLDI